MIHARITGIAVVALAASAASAATFDQDYSPDIDAPTDLGIFAVGITTVEGFVIDAFGANADVDVFTFQIGAGRQLVSLFYDADTTNRPFIGIDAGAVFSEDPNSVGNPADALFIGGLVASPGQDILPLLGASGIGQGFSGPLGPGAYTVFVQQIGNNPTNYSLVFEVVPAPSAGALAAVGALFAARRRR